MVISASRRTDIPAFLADWFFQGLRRGSVVVRAPFNASLEKKISLRKADVDAFVFWTRNPSPFFPVLDFLDKGSYPYYFLITVNHYPSFLEPSCPDLHTAASFFRKLCARIGADRIAWRYDPVVFTPQMGVRFHKKNFSLLAASLRPFCNRVIISFVDFYAKVEKRLARQGVQCLWPEQHPDWREEMLGFFSEHCHRYGLAVQTCAEAGAAAGVAPGKCIDEELLNRLFALRLRYHKDPGQRRHCRCQLSLDIGTYRTCASGCLYCYAC